jgi:hypothetical protein
MSMPREAITRTTSGCSGLGWLPALNARTRPPDRTSVSASAAWERALLPVHKNSTVRAAPLAAGGAGCRRSPGCNAAPASVSNSAQRARSRW